MTTVHQINEFLLRNNKQVADTLTILNNLNTRLTGVDILESYEEITLEFSESGVLNEIDKKLLDFRNNSEKLKLVASSLNEIAR